MLLVNFASFGLIEINHFYFLFRRFHHVDLLTSQNEGNESIAPEIGLVYISTHLYWAIFDGSDKSSLYQVAYLVL